MLDGFNPNFPLCWTVMPSFGLLEKQQELATAVTLNSRFAHVLVGRQSTVKKDSQLFSGLLFKSTAF